MQRQAGKSAVCKVVDTAPAAKKGAHCPAGVRAGRIARMRIPVRGALPPLRSPRGAPRCPGSPPRKLGLSPPAMARRSFTQPARRTWAGTRPTCARPGLLRDPRAQRGGAAELQPRDIQRWRAGTRRPGVEKVAWQARRRRARIANLALLGLAIGLLLGHLIGTRQRRAGPVRAAAGRRPQTPMRCSASPPRATDDEVEQAYRRRMSSTIPIA